jgi:hypothetical protein
MFDELKISQIKKLITTALERYAKELNKPIEEVCFYIYTESEAGDPKLKVLLTESGKLKVYKSITFGDLCTDGEKFLYKMLSFDVEKDTPVWIQKFLIKSAADHKIDIKVPKYILVVLKSDLHAYMYVNDKQIEEIKLSYILETR